MGIAHINPKTKKEQSVAEHSRGVGKYCRDFGRKIGIEETSGLTGEMHDFGKEKMKFEDYIRKSIDNPEDKSLKGKINHSTAGAKYVFDSFFDGDPYKKLTAQLLALVILGHHGGIPDVIDLNGQDILSTRLNPEKDISYDECRENFTRNCLSMQQISESFEKSRDEIEAMVEKMKKTGLFDQFTFQIIVKYLFSCLVDSDRLDTYCFMEDKPYYETKIKTHDLWVELSARLEEAISRFPKETRINALRKEISDECKYFAANKPGIYRMCVPTGGGKTLSSLRYALEHAKIKEFNKERIFYIIPYTTIIDQNAKVIKDVLKRDDVILEHHSNLIIDNENEDYKLLTERWDTPIILTTMVQFLNTFYSAGTQNIRRLHNLANSVIIFDEIQSVPIKCINMLNSALNFLAKLCNATIILCTATQPPLSYAPKPLLINTPSDIIKNVEDRFFQFERVRLIDDRKVGGYEYSGIADFVLNKVESENNALVVLNTKKSAREVYKQLKGINDVLSSDKKFKLFHLSTNMCPKHRMQVLDEIKSSLGKERVICVSTQLIEAGVDISFRCVVRAVAGFDSIVQAAGRCNRNAEEPFGYAYIINLENEDLSMLPDIKEGIRCSNRVLDEFKENPEVFDNDLISPKVINQYYHYYYSKKADEMSYNIKKENIKLYDLLSANSKSVNAYRDKNGNWPGYPIRQAFETASRRFTVIDDNTTSVMVPFEKGKELITKINGDCSFEELRTYIKQAQQYSVNLYENDLRKIGKGIYLLRKGGILALQDNYYDEHLGVVTEGGIMDLLLL